jgi:hypothetical protein
MDGKDLSIAHREKLIAFLLPRSSSNGQTKSSHSEPEWKSTKPPAKASFPIPRMNTRARRLSS